MVCWCGTNYQARQADIKRGWGGSCSKSCAAIERERTKGKTIKKKVQKKKDKSRTGRAEQWLIDDCDIWGR